MTETCPYCGNQYKNTKALGSHIHYMHKTRNPTEIYAAEERSESDIKRFQLLYKSCLSDSNLPMLSNIEKVEQAMSEIPKGISPILDNYRKAFKCALIKEELLNDFEGMVQEDEGK